MIKRLSHFVSFSVAATVCTFALQSFATHVMTPTEFGVFAKWLTDINYLSIFLIFGLDHAILYFSKVDRHYSAYAIRNAILFSIVFSTACILAGLFKLPLDYYFPLFLAIFSFSLYQTFNAFNQFSERIRLYGLFNLVRAATLLVPFVYAYAMDMHMTALSVFVLYAATSVFLALIMAIQFYFSVGHVVLPSRVFDLEYIKYGAKSMLNALLAVSLYTATIYCLDYLGSKEMLAYFFIAAAISKLAWVIPDAVGNILYPKFLKIGNGYSEKDVISETYYLAQLTLFINLVALMGFLLLGHLVIELIFNKEYVAAYLPVVILMIGNQGMVFYKVLGRYLASMNKWSSLRSALFFGVVINIVLSFALIPKFGVVGAAVASAVSFWACGLVVCIAVPGSLVGFLNLKSFVTESARMLKAN